MQDVLGLHASGDKKIPKFVKQYANLKEDVLAAVSSYVSEVKDKSFPGSQTVYCSTEPEIVKKVSNK